MFKIELEYPTSSNNKPRYTQSQPNKYISQALEANHEMYRQVLQNFPKYFKYLANIDADSNEDPKEPLYINPHFPGFDSVSLYCLIAELKPNTYIEVGSGNSTKFARRAINDHHLKTQIISIDPYPRSEIDDICDRVIRQPVEDIDIAIFENLEKNDIVFIDNSHRCFMNSDVTVCFLDIMPRLNPGVYLQIHDIFWPFDYPESWQERYYNEQYLLGALLTNGLNDYEIVLPVYYASLHPELSSILHPLWSADEKFDRVYKHGGSFWMQKKKHIVSIDSADKGVALWENEYQTGVHLNSLTHNELDDANFLQTTSHLDNEAFVKAAYRAYLQREVDRQGYNHFFNILSNDSSQRSQIPATIRQSQEFQSLARARYWKVKLKEFDYSKYPKRLNLGCGSDIRQGYLNIDIHNFFKPDLVADIRYLDALPADYYEEIVAQDCLEHLPRCDTEPVLKVWSRLLKPGGILKIRTTSLVDLVELLKAEQYQSLEGHKQIIYCLFAPQSCEGDWHFTAFTQPLLTHYLEQAGLGKIQVQVVHEWLFDVQAEKIDLGKSQNETITAIIGQNLQPIELDTEVFLQTNNHSEKDNFAIMNDVSIQPNKINDATFLQESAHLSNQDFVQAVYRTYLLRDADVQGYHHFFTLLTDRKCTRQQVVSTIRESAEFKAQELKLKLKGFDYSKYPRRLNLGCGWDIKQGYLNVDLHDFGKPDLVADIRHLDLLPSGYYEEIIAQDCLEHMPRCDTLPALKGWARLLKQGGILKIRTTSLIDLLELFKSEQHQSVEAQQLLVQFLYGSQACEGDWHLTGFTKTLITRYLEEVGLGNIEYQVVYGWLMDVTAEKIRS
jgi:predicted SAM-dependent methyltransferase